MIARVSRGQSGLAKYLKDGHRKDSEYSRDEKDHVLPLYGDLDIFERTEKYLNENKDYQDNYLHITLSLNKEDLERLNAAEDKESIYRDMVETYIKHHTSGYDLDNEVIAYAEAHIPKIKEEHDKERLEHIHIAIALYNPLDDTKLRTTFAENDFIDNALQEYVNRKNGLTNPHQFKRERDGINADTNTARNRKYFINELKDIQNKDELIEYFQVNRIEYREVETAKNHYFKIITPDDQKDINLRGKGFEHLSDIAQGKEIANNKNRAVEELENILSNYYKKRIDQIHGRRSASSREMIESIYDDKELPQKEPGENVIYPSFKQKLFLKHYGKKTNNKFIGYQIDLHAESGVKFTNKSKGIEVVDRGDRITGGNTGNVRDQAALMLDIAEAKGWPLNALGINGSEAFKIEVHRQIAERLKEREDLIKNPGAIEIARPTSEAEKLAAVLADEKYVEKAEKRVLDRYEGIAPRPGTPLNKEELKSLATKYTKERNEAAKVSRENAEFRTAQRNFMDIQIAMRDGVNMEDVYAFNDSQIEAKRLSVEDAQRFADNTLKNARELTKIGILQESLTGRFHFVDAKAKEILSQNIGANYTYLFNLNVMEWEKAVDLSEEKQMIKLVGTIDLAIIKSDLSAAAVLQYAADKYKLNTANYELTDDNKINNLLNKQKPKNVIDFLQKEINLTGKESIEICEELFKNQPLKIQAVPIIGAEKKLTTRKNYEPTKEQRAVALRKPGAQSNARRKSNTANNLPVLSASELVSDIKSVELLLQNYDDADLHRRSEDVNNRLRYANVGNDSIASRSGNSGGIDMNTTIQSNIHKQKLEEVKKAVANGLDPDDIFDRYNLVTLYHDMGGWPVYGFKGVDYQLPPDEDDLIAYEELSTVGFGEECQIIANSNNLLSQTNTKELPAAKNDSITSRSSGRIEGDITKTLQISICKDPNLNALNKWETVNVANYTELATLMKQYPYSAAQFKNGYRNLENASGSGNILIYDIDNDKGNPQLSINEAKILLETHGISALILPSKSNNKEKPVQKSKASYEGETHVAERYRIIIPTADSLPNEMEKDTYREFQKLTAKSLGLDQYIDSKALNDKARFYYKSPIVAVPHIVKANAVMKIDPFVQQAQSNLNARKAEAEKERQRIAQIRRNIANHRQTTGETVSRHLTHADVDKLMSLQIAELIKHLEKADEYKEGDYHMLKTDSAKYSVVEENVAHDFKNEVTYNNITYLQKHYKTENLNAIAKELERETGESYIKTNIEEVQRAIEVAMRDAENDRALQEALKEHFGVKYCKLDVQHDMITIAGREIKLHEINQNKEQMIKQFRENREQEAQRKQRKGFTLSL